ncbi:hypothetical protein EEW87_002945 [Janibacter melonis]|uniref:LppX_LprAFG lipoprotein n=1 Tax=Janibacter melonis TaxID=262209 RepID=A0A5P8FJ31_9MICO|nr:hypothetical protein [Janibacter melonis]QFQ29516.2 hypothetical protein EEW87_002945 [Janibacter melonis]
MSRRTVVVLAAAGATTVVLSACSVLGGGGPQAEPTYVAPSTTTTAPSADTAPVGQQPATLPLASQVLESAKSNAQEGGARSVTISAVYPLAEDLGVEGPMTVRSSGSTGGNRSELTISMPDGSSLEQRDLGNGELYLRLEDGDVRKPFDIDLQSQLVRNEGRWVRTYSQKRYVEAYTPNRVIRDSFLAGELEKQDMRYAILDQRELDGEQVYGVLVRPATDETKDVVRTVWVTKDAPYRFLRYETGDVQTRTSIVFSKWGTTPLPSERPKDAKKVDFSDL